MTVAGTNEELLQDITELQQLGGDASAGSRLFDEILARLLRRTRSEYGVVAEVVVDAGGTPHLRAHSSTHQGWFEEPGAVYEVEGDGHRETLPLVLARAARSGMPAIARAGSPPSGSAPSGVLALPLCRGEQAVGLVAVGAARAPYDAALIRYLQPLLGTCTTLLDAFVNESRRQRLVSALRASEERFRSVTENALDLVSILRPDGTVQYASPSHERLLGYPPAQLVGQSLFAFIPPEDLPRGLTAGAAAPGEGEGSFAEFRFRHRDGSWRVLEGVGKPVLDGQNLAAIVVNARDITEHRRAAAELSSALSLLGATLEATTDALLVVDRRNRIVSFNQKFLHMWNLPTSAIATGDDADVLLRTINQLKDPLGFRRRVQELQAQEDAESHDFVEFVDGRVFERYSQPQRIAGVCVGRVWSFRDVTERHRAEQSQQLEARVAAALARVGREMITSLDAPVLLDRVCQLAVETLDCEFSRTLLWRPRQGVYVPMAGHGHTKEQWEALRVLQIPQPVVAPLLARLDRQDAVAVDAGAPAELQPLVRAMPDGALAVLYVALRRGGEVTGVLGAGYRTAGRGFSAAQHRIVAGMAQLASFALENARLFDELQTATRLRADFVATMSHELRTPLHIIMGYSDLLLEGEFGALLPQQVDRLQRLAKNAHSLLDLINATLDVSRLEAGRVPLKTREIRLPDFVSEIDGDMREWLDKPKVRFSCTVAPDVPRLHSDPTKLKVLLKNLLGNALKFTEEGRVTLDVRPADSGVLFTVSDTGIGIAPEARSFIFDPFRQAEATMTRSYGGAGLGLYIVRRLLEMLAGTIELDSETGRGSVFRVWIPLHRPPEIPVPPSPG